MTVLTSFDFTSGVGSGSGAELLDVVGPDSKFTAEAKLRYLELLKVTPNYAKCCEMTGISRWTFKNHYKVDREFKRRVDEIRESLIDDIEQLRFDVARRPNGTLDRMAVLNAYRRETYNPSTKIEVEHTLTVDDARRRMESLGSVVDAEIVGKVRELKARNRRALTSPLKPKP